MILSFSRVGPIGLFWDVFARMWASKARPGAWLVRKDHNDRDNNENFRVFIIVIFHAQEKELGETKKMQLISA